MSPVRALSITQPWASLVMEGVKTIETRSWATEHRGELVIHASKGLTAADREFTWRLHESGVLQVHPDSMPLGAALGTVRLFDVVRFGGPDLVFLGPETTGYRRGRRKWAIEPEEDLGDFTDGRYGWLLADPAPFVEPYPCKGSLGLWGYRGDLPRPPAVRDALVVAGIKYRIQSIDDGVVAARESFAPRREVAVPVASLWWDRIPGVWRSPK